MNLLSLVFGEVKGVFGKTYVLAGMLPAGLLVIGYEWYASGEGFGAFITDLVTHADQAPGWAAMATLVLLVGLAFFAARLTLLRVTQTLVLDALRRPMIRRQLGRRAKAQHEKEMLSAKLTTLSWVLGDERIPAFSDPPSPMLFLPRGYAIPDAASAAKGSAEARTELSKLLPAGCKPVEQPTRKQAETIVDALLGLYASGSKHSEKDPWKEEVLEWKKRIGVPDENVQLALEHRHSRVVLRGLRKALHGDIAAVQARIDRFPAPEWMQPTVLGARASALDDYAEKRYGIDTSTMLQRLTGTLDKDDGQELSDARLSVEVLNNLMFATLLVSLLVGIDDSRLILSWAWRGNSPLDLSFDGRVLLFLVVPVFAAWVFYRSAVEAFEAYGEKVEQLVDLHRLDLLEELGHPLPDTVEEEVELWKELSAFFRQNGERDPERKIAKRS